MTEFRLRATLVALALAIAGCGADTKTGSNGTGITPPAIEPTVVAGTLTGAEPLATGNLTYDTAAASVRQDATAGAGTANLRLGMFLEATGSTTGVAPTRLAEASVQSAIRGPVTAVDIAGGRFTVASLLFDVDGNTLFDGIAGIGRLAVGETVEVFALPVIEARVMLATRVTKVAPAPDGRFSIAARIEQSSAIGFVLAGLSVAAPISVSASPVPLAGTRARVTGKLNAEASAISPDRIDLLPEYPPALGTRTEFEGIVITVENTGGFRLRTPARDFTVTSIPAGTPLIASGTRVRLLGRATSGTTIEPQFVNVIAPGEAIVYRVTGAVSEFASLASMRVRGEPVDLTTAVISGGSPADIANGRRLSIAGTAGPGALRVTEVAILP